MATLEDVAILQQNVDSFFLVTNGIIIFFMQCGFAFLECGAVRSKNATNILLKNILDSFLGAIAYWIFGFAFAYGSEGNRVIGYEYFVSADLPTTATSYWFFQFVFAATAATIVSGAMAERCEFAAYMLYSVFITGFIYPVVSRWAWHPDGWLVYGIPYTIDDVEYRASYMDFAGSGVVHLLGGSMAIVGAAILGPRIGRFDHHGDPREIRGHSVPMAAMGGFILYFGFLSFNSGSQGSISSDGDGAVIGLACVNTIISGSFGAVTAMLVQRIVIFVGGRSPKWSLLTTINGGLTGMVAICAGCNALWPWAAMVTGILSGLAYLGWSAAVLALRVDDPIDAFAVHFGGGLLGLIVTPILAVDVGIVYNWDQHSGMLLAANVVGALAIIAWSVVFAILIFGALRLLRILRVRPEIERKGMDIPKHGEPAYPMGSYGDGWDDALLAITAVTSSGSGATLVPAWLVLLERDADSEATEPPPFYMRRSRAYQGKPRRRRYSLDSYDDYSGPPIGLKRGVLVPGAPVSYGINPSSGYAVPAIPPAMYG